MNNTSNVSVLLIEDNKESADITKTLLERSSKVDFSITVASSLHESMEILMKDNGFDVVLLDLVLPNGEGLSVFEQVNEHTDKPIVIISGYEDKAIECVKHGAQDYIVKPYYDIDSLTRSIMYAIERHNWERKYEKLVEGTHAAIYEIDFIGNCFTYINDVGLKELGYTKDEMLMLKPIDFLTTDSYLKWMNRLSKIQMGEPIPPVEEYQVKRKDGSILWVLITADYKYEKGFIVGASVVAINITDRKNKEQQLDSIYRTAPVGIGLIKGNRVIVEVNDRLCEMVGYNREELIYQSAKILYPSKEEYERVGKLKYKKIRETGIGIVETQLKRKDGKLIDVLLTSSYMDKSNKQIGVTFSVLDITKSKEIERRLEEEFSKRLDDWKSESGISLQNSKLDTILNL